MSTSSISFPNMINVTNNSVAVLTGDVSVINRTRLLMLTEPNELYNSMDFGVGLKQYLWQYNTVNVKAIIQDRIIEQLRKYEPCCVPDDTTFADGLLYSGNYDDLSAQEFNKLKMTVGLKTIYSNNVTLDLSDDYTIAQTLSQLSEQNERRASNE